MELAALFDDFPLVNFRNVHPHRSRSRPLMFNLLSSLEDQMDQRVGHDIRRLPALLLDLENEYVDRAGNRNRKMRCDVPLYEPKSKVMVTTKDNKFQVNLDTSSYQPEEISVKVVNNKIAISAKHESKGDEVYEYSEMYRSFDLPAGVDPNSITSRLAVNGQLTVEAPMKTTEALTERTIPVAIQKNEQQAVENSETSMKAQISQK